MRDVIPRQCFRVGQQVGICGWRDGFAEAEVLAFRHEHNNLGGRWDVLTLRFPDGETVEGVDSRQYVFVGPEYVETTWCPTCDTRVEVEDKHEEGDPATGAGPEGVVTDLTCGHSIFRETV